MDIFPILVNVTRGDMVESRHRGSIVVVDTKGSIVFSLGDFAKPVYPRSAIKPLQALPLVEAGTDAKQEEIAIACASHGGEKRHVATVAAWLRRLGLSEADLACGTHMPSHGPTAEAMIRAGEQPNQMHNNCSGKHTGILATCRKLGDPVGGYLEPDHPANRRIVAAWEQMCGVELARAPRGVDGCGLPQIGIPLQALARGMARLGAPADLPPARAKACKTIAAAMLAHPFMLAGTGRFCTRAIEAARGKVLLKTGAEAVYMGAIPAKGLGFALKIEDGTTRAAEAACAALIARFADLDAAEKADILAIGQPDLFNRAGAQVGQVQAARW